jgi:pyrroline-5-carboxylate reductase
MSESYLDDLGTLVSNVSSKGGTTEQAINVLKNKNFKEIISQAVASAFKRAVEIGNNR